MNLKVCLNFWVCFVLCVALILQPRTVYREWEQEADFKIWNHSPTEISGKGPLDYIHLIHPRGHYLSRFPSTSQTLIDNLNGKILCALGSFFHRIPITSVGKPLHLALEFYHPKPVEFSCQLLRAVLTRWKVALTNHFHHSFSKLYVKVVVLPKAQKQMFEWLGALHFTNSGLPWIPTDVWQTQGDSLQTERIR